MCMSVCLNMFYLQRTSQACICLDAFIRMYTLLWRKSNTTLTPIETLELKTKTTPDFGRAKTKKTKTKESLRRPKIDGYSG